MISLLLIACLLFLRCTSAQLTIHHASHRPAHTSSADPASYTSSGAYSPLQLIAPPIPDPLPPMNFDIQLQDGFIPGSSIPHSGSFFGFSIEMSIADQILGKNSNLVEGPFLNLLANIQRRAGLVRVRIWGASQDSAHLVTSLDEGRVLKNSQQGTLFTTGLFDMMKSISNLVNVRWFLGIPFGNSTNINLDIAEYGTAILADLLIGIALGNKPDTYAHHQRRPLTYTPFDYFGEVGSVVKIMSENPRLTQASHLLVGPNIANAWKPESVWDTGFIDAYSSNLAFLSAERYPNNNCFSRYGFGKPIDAQNIFSRYLIHSGVRNLTNPYINSTILAQSKGKQMLMFETNTASCGGFAGLSDSFGAALWGIDYALQMANANFSGAMFHVSGRNASYNPFTPPPRSESSHLNWTVGPIYYSALAVAETLGTSNKSQVLDLNANGGNDYTPAYAIYEDGIPKRVALINYISDPSGRSVITVSITVGSGVKQIKVKYLKASSVNQKGNFTWAGQTFGQTFESDGRMQGNEDIQTVNCDTSTGICTVSVPAPGFALVFLSGEVFTETSTPFPGFNTTRTVPSATIDPFALATSNGRKGGGPLGSTSRGSAENGEAPRWATSSIYALFSALIGAMMMF